MALGVRPISGLRTTFQGRTDTARHQAVPPATPSPASSRQTETDPLDVGAGAEDHLRVSSAEVLVGREAERALGTAAARLLAEGRAAALTIEGEAGIGKTRLAQSIADDARSHGLTVFWGQAHPFERTRPFGVVAEALGLDRRSADPRRSAIGALLTGGGVAAPTTTLDDIRYRVVEEILDLVETECAHRPVLLVTEDVHWADSASLLAIGSVVRRLPLAPLFVVTTARPAPQGAALVRLLDDLEAGGATPVRLHALPRDDVVELAHHVLEAAPGPILTAMVAKAGGNPLWVMAILRSLTEEGRLRWSGGSVEATVSELPASLGDLVVRRLRDLPAETLELLQVTAVLGDAVSLRDVSAVSRRPPAEVVRQLGPAFDARLLDEAGDRVVFRYQLVHDAVYQHLPAPARHLLHRAAAVALMTAGADRLDVADHLMLGAERGDEEAIAWLRDAARDASARAPSVTVELLRRAEALLPPGHRDADLVAAEVVHALLRAGAVADASARTETVLARPHATEVDVPLRIALLGALALQNRAAELITAAEASLADPDRLRSSDHVLILAQQSWALTYTGDPLAGESAAGRALVIAQGADDPAMIVWALTALLVAVGRQGRFGEALTHARRAAGLAADFPDTRSLPLQPKLFLGLTLFDCDLIEEARTAYRGALDDEFGSAWWLSDTLMADAEASFVLGEWEDAVPGLVAGGQAAREKGNPLLVTQSLAYRAIIATATGDHRLATELVSGIVGALEGDRLSYNAGILASALAGVTAARGDPQGAYDVLLRCWRFDVARANRYYHRCLAPDLVRLGLALGHRDVAGEVASAVADGAALAPDVATVQSVALRCQGLVTGEVEPLVEAVALARRPPLLVEHCGACEDAAGALAQVGRRADAAALLAEALERYEHAGAEWWAGRVRARLRDLGLHPAPRGPRRRPERGWESLTATEQAVSRLVAEGLTNGAVARQLYISPHTVNTHLRHVFAKLGVTNRVALAGVVLHSIK